MMEMEEMKKMMEMEKKMEKEMEEEEIILPQPAPMLVEDTREHKPVWTVTRQRPRKTIVKPTKTKTQVQPEAKVVKKVCWIGGGRSALTCKQVRRKLVGEEDAKVVKQQQGRRRIQLKQVKEGGSKRAEMKEKSRMLLHPEPQDGNKHSDPEEISLQLANRMMEEEELSSEDRKAITLKEAFDQTINKLGSELEEEEDTETMDAERLRSMSQEYSDTLTKLLDQLEDSERQYVDSSDLRQGDF